MSEKSSKKRRILIGIVAFDGILGEAQGAALKALYDLGKYHSKDYEFILEMIIKAEQFRAKNRLTKVALVNKCEFMWQIDDDTVLNPHTFSTLMKMLDDEPDAGIAGCLYSHKGENQNPVVMWVDMTPAGNTVAEYYQPYELTGEVMEVGVTGGGCMMFRMAAFKEMVEPFFWNEADLGTDLQICVRMQQAGWKVLCHTGHEVGHVGARKVWYPSVLEPVMAEMHRFCEKLYFDVLEYLGINGDEYRFRTVQSIGRFQEIWLEMRPETSTEIKGVYEEHSMQDLAVVRHIFYNNKKRKNWGEFHAYIHNTKPKRALDYGCGVGYGAQMLCEIGAETLAIDLDVGPLDFLEWRGKKYGFEDKLEVVRIKESDGNGVGYLPDENFDVIVLKDVLEHLANPEEVLRETLARLNPGGIILSNAHIDLFLGPGEGNPQHLDLLGAEKFGEICTEYGVGPYAGWILRKEE